MLNQKTHQPKKEEIKRKWHIIDVQGQILGRAATKIAYLLIGKGKKEYTPHFDAGDYVIVVNAAEVKVTGRKEDQKTYYRHSGYPGGLRSIVLKDLREKAPTKVIEHAVHNMLPKNRLRSDRMTRLKVFAASVHPYAEKLKGKKED